MLRKLGRQARNAALGLAAAGMMMAAGATGVSAQEQEAANKVLPGLTAEEIISILTKHEIQSQKARLPGNDPLILAQMSSGAKFFVRLQSCGEKGGNCQVVQYGAIFTGADLPANDFNTFNARYAFGKAYEDPEKKMYIEHAVSVAGGIRRQAVEVNLFVFFRMADLFTRFLSQRMNSVSASADQPADTKSDAISNMAGNLPANSSLASFRETAEKHPEIVNTVKKGALTEWKTK